jgi:hypothetical protein
MTVGIIMWRTVDRFFRKFIGKSGWRDGYLGFMVAIFDSFYQLMSYAKFRQMTQEQQKNMEITA